MSKLYSKFSGIKDVDLLILMILEDADLFKICLLNKYFNSLCNDEYFWYNRIVKKYGKDVANKNINKKWKKYYLNILNNSINLYKKYPDILEITKQLLSKQFVKTKEYYLSPIKRDYRDILVQEKIQIPNISDNYYILIINNEIISPIFTNIEDLIKFSLKKNKKFTVTLIKDRIKDLEINF